jgi:RimJ/RimL family protein N-acetyltransferase
MNANSNPACKNAPLSSLTIRPNTPGDASRIRTLISTVADEGLWLVTDTYVETPQWENAFLHPNDFSNLLLLVAESGDQIIGWCRVFPVFGDKSRHVVDLGVGVSKEWRDRGVGTGMMNAAIQWAKRQAFEKLVLSVFVTNARAIHVFEKVGFVSTGIRYKQFKVKSEYVDEVFMERSL